MSNQKSIDETSTESEEDKEKSNPNENASEDTLHNLRQNYSQISQLEDQHLFIQRIIKIIDHEVESIITKIYEYHIHKQSSSIDRDLKISEKNVIHKFFTQINFYLDNAGDDFSLTILKVLTEKIPKIIKVSPYLF